ncbi:MAG: cytochrome c [Chloroflexi bacterium]|nr:cytochrome c [Chloroflexota bacterium]
MNGRIPLAIALTLLATLICMVALLSTAASISEAIGSANDESDFINPVPFKGVAVAPLPRPDAGRIERGARVYTAQCAKCHGATLQGAPQWPLRQPDGSYPAAPLDASGPAWRNRDTTIIDVITNGNGPAGASGMPAFRTTLSPAEVVDVMDYIKSRWSRDQRRKQWWQTQRDAETSPE